MFAWSSGRLNTAAGGEVRRVEGLWVSGELSRCSASEPAIGRLLHSRGRSTGLRLPGAVISHAYWQRAFGGAPSVLQQTVRLEGVKFDIIGVTAPDFFGLDVGRRFDVAIPICAERLTAEHVGREPGAAVGGSR